VRLLNVFRTLRKSARLHRERLLALVMLPAFFLGTLPRVVCICADGHREPFCPMAGGKIASGKSACCGCSCCTKENPAGTRDCCRSHHHRGVTRPGWSGPNHPGCHLLVEAPAPAVKTNAAKVSDSESWASAPQPEWAIAAQVRSQPPRCHQPPVWPPPVDFLVVYLHLTI
jgi:hypothetical protein